MTAERPSTPERVPGSPPPIALPGPSPRPTPEPSEPPVTAPPTAPDSASTRDGATTPAENATAFTRDWLRYVQQQARDGRIELPEEVAEATLSALSCPRPHDNAEAQVGQSLCGVHIDLASTLIDWFEWAEGLTLGVAGLSAPLLFYLVSQIDEFVEMGGLFPEWLPVDDIVNDPAVLEGLVYGAAELAAGSASAGPPAAILTDDFPGSHYTHDVNFEVIPDPAKNSCYPNLIGLQTFYADPCPRERVQLERLQAEMDLEIRQLTGPIHRPTGPGPLHPLQDGEPPRTVRPSRKRNMNRRSRKFRRATRRSSRSSGTNCRVRNAGSPPPNRARRTPWVSNGSPAWLLRTTATHSSEQTCKESARGSTQPATNEAKPSGIGRRSAIASMWKACGSGTAASLR